jgi:thiol-disulfide isomerase/thioredoxin
MTRRINPRLAALVSAVVLASAAPAAPAAAQVVQITPDQAALRVRYEKGTRVVLFYSYSCPYSREAFPGFLELARRYAPEGVSWLAFSLDDDPEILDAYLGRDLLPFDRQLILPEGPGAIGRAFAAENIRVPARASTPSVVVIGPDDRIVGQVAGTDGPGRAETWLRQLGFAPE